MLKAKNQNIYLTFSKQIGLSVSVIIVNNHTAWLISAQIIWFL